MTLDSQIGKARHAVVACYLGWMLDAFDYFVMIYVFDDVASSFGVGLPIVAWAITATLAMRAVGALVFGRLADRYGRRRVLMASVLTYSVVEFASGLAPGLASFIVLRALFGVAMGGEWGIGASLAMESVPARWRGPVSGLLQSGYPSGYLLATLLYYLGHDALGWRGMFMVGAAPALLVLYIRRNVEESPDWLARRSAPRVPLSVMLRRRLPLTIYAVLLMAAFNFLSHGTQDLYPKGFLRIQRGFSKDTVSHIAMIYNVGAIIGGIGFGAVSQRIGRRAGIALACLLCLPIVPLWAFASTPVVLGLGAFLMQICVQGAWGIVPAYLNELSPPAIRATFPGLVYQLGNLIASANAPLQSGWAASLGGDYRWPLAITVSVVAAMIVVLIGFGRTTWETGMKQD